MSSTSTKTLKTGSEKEKNTGIQLQLISVGYVALSVVQKQKAYSQ